MRAAGAALLLAACLEPSLARYMDCGHGVPLCGVLTLESGYGSGPYHHSQPVVHGLWPQVPRYGSSKCIAPKKNTKTSTVYDCYSESSQSLHKVLWFEAHEWQAHGRCAGAVDEDDFFEQVCKLSDKPLGVMTSAYKKGFKAMVAAVKKAKLPVFNVDNHWEQIELSVCAGKDGRWKIAAQKDFPKVCGPSASHGKKPTPTPSKPAKGQVCSHMHPGPTCHSDRDCAGVPGCLRCARSGHCTDVRLLLEAAAMYNISSAFTASPVRANAGKHLAAVGGVAAVASLILLATTVRLPWRRAARAADSQYLSL